MCPEVFTMGTTSSEHSRDCTDSCTVNVGLRYWSTVWTRSRRVCVPHSVGYSTIDTTIGVSIVRIPIFGISRISYKSYEESRETCL